MSISKAFKETKEKINAISSSFCLAKWHHLTIYLFSGYAHSCHHPRSQKVSLDGLSKDPSLLHNTPDKIKARQEMLTGQRPQECNYCWTFEDNNKDQISDRISKSYTLWQDSTVQNILNSPIDTKFNPHYLELSFSKLCNLKCVYCGPHLSSSWVDEIKEFGNIKERPVFSSSEYSDESLSTEPELNPYIQAFWAWWPSLKKDLKILRITGGEPLLSADFLKFIDLLPNEKLDQTRLTINSNLNVSPARLKLVTDKLSRLIAENKIKDITFVTSLESGDLQAQYIRHGFEPKNFWPNLETLRRLGVFNISITATLTPLSLDSLYGLYENAVHIKKVKASPKKFMIDPSLLKSPLNLNLLYYPQLVRSSLIAEIEKIISSADRFMLNDYEIIRLATIKDVLTKAPQHSDYRIVASFRNYLSELDQRRGTNYVSTFPRLFEVLRGREPLSHYESKL